MEYEQEQKEKEKQRLRLLRLAKRKAYIFILNRILFRIRPPKWRDKDRLKKVKVE